MVLVDSTAWIGFLRGEEGHAVRRLRRLLEAGEAAVAPVIVQEVLQGASSPQAFRTLRARFALLPLLGAEGGSTLHEAAAELYARCRWRGITPRSPNDCLVAVTALHHDVPLLHDDRDFEHLATVVPRLRLMRG